MIMGADRGSLLRLLSRAALVPAAVLAVGAVVPAVASAHAIVAPSVSLSGKLQLYSLAVPTEKEGVTTSKVVLTVPSGFGIDSFAPPPAGWTQTVQHTGSGESAVVTKATWSAGKTPTGEDAVFQFLAEPSAAKSYVFTVQQTYSDGSVVNWSGPESSDSPAPTVEAKSSLGGGGSSVLSIIALVVAILAFAVAGFALVGRGPHDRPLA